MRFVLIFPLLLACSVWLGGRDRNQGGKQKEDTVIIFRSADGRTLTMEDLRGVTGTFRWEVVGRMDVPAEAESLHEQGRQAGRVGDYNKALTLLERSSNVAPGWPYPVYDMAYTFLLMKDADNARKYYRKTVELTHPATFVFGGALFLTR